MGTTGTNREKGLSTLEFFQKEFPVSLGERGRVLASAVVKTGESARYGGWPEVFYAAVEKLPYEAMSDYEASQVGTVLALVIPFIRGSGYYNIHYKEMDETVGPCESSCPARILDLLSPTDSEWANEWRARCRDHNAKLDRVKALRSGDTIVLAKAVSFTNGASADRLTLVDKKRWRWTDGPGYGYHYFRLTPADLTGCGWEVAA